MKTRNHSKKREAILSKIRSTKIHPNAEWVYNELKADFPDLSLATVYRNITLFLEDGTLQTVATVSGRERFDGDLSPHQHFICKTCDAIIDLHIDLPQGDLEQSFTASEMELDHLSLIAYGTCATCRKANDALSS